MSYLMSYLTITPGRSYCQAMARMTVYIPDDLLERAKATQGDPEVKVSQLVQRGLEALLGHGLPVYAERPDDVSDEMNEARDALIAGARQEYKQGYRAAAARAR